VHCGCFAGEFPWQVSLQLLSGWTARHICGGAVLSAYWVATAGHCTAGLSPSVLSVVAGDHDLYAEEGKHGQVFVRVNSRRIGSVIPSLKNINTSTRDLISATSDRTHTRSDRIHVQHIIEQLIL
jgi:secreted trypsin-like serine protease